MGHEVHGRRNWAAFSFCIPSPRYLPIKFPAENAAQSSRRVRSRDKCSRMLQKYFLDLKFSPYRGELTQVPSLGVHVRVDALMIRYKIYVKCLRVALCLRRCTSIDTSITVFDSQMISLRRSRREWLQKLSLRYLTFNYRPPIRTVWIFIL